MVDHLFADCGLAALYDSFCGERGDFDFYLPLVMSAKSVLDVGCGTGALLHMARAAGHSGRLCGLDPANGMLDQARKRIDIEWVLGDIASAAWRHEFDLVIMTGNAFQVLIEDNELRTAFTAVKLALDNAGRFVFETRNPSALEWERWGSHWAREVTDGNGSLVRMTCDVERPVVGNTVSFTHTFTSPNWEHPQQSRSTLRFHDVKSLNSLITNGGFEI